MLFWLLISELRILLMLFLLTNFIIKLLLSFYSSSAVNPQSKESDNIEEMGRNLRKSVSLHLNNNNENSAVTKALSNSKLLDESLKQPLQVNIVFFFSF